MVQELDLDSLEHHKIDEDEDLFMRCTSLYPAMLGPLGMEQQYRVVDVARPMSLQTSADEVGLSGTSQPGH